MTREIVELLAHERGMRAEQIRPADRLLEDLGMDGDDAVEFFETFEARFKVDLAPLHDHWDQHFGPEGFGPPWLAPLSFAALAWLGLAKLGAGPVWATAPLAPGLALAVWLAWKHRRRRKRRPHIPLTVQDLFDAAETGRWSIGYA